MTCFLLSSSHHFSCWGQSACYCSPALPGWWSCQRAGGSIAADTQCKKSVAKISGEESICATLSLFSKPPTMAEAQRTEGTGNLVRHLMGDVSSQFFSCYQGHVTHWHSHTTGKGVWSVGHMTWEGPVEQSLSLRVTTSRLCLNKASALCDSHGQWSQTWRHGAASASATDRKREKNGEGVRHWSATA